MKNQQDIAMVISPKNPDSRWVALDSNDKIISEGKTPQEAISVAEKIDKNYSMMFIPVAGNTYIF